jgi:hypothetical protein
MAWIEDLTAPSSWSGAFSLAAVRFGAQLGIGDQ